MDNRGQHFLAVEKGTDPEGFVFSADTEGKIPLSQNSFRGRFKAILRKAGFDSKIRIHALRHT